MKTTLVTTESDTADVLLVRQFFKCLGTPFKCSACSHPTLVVYPLKTLTTEVDYLLPEGALQTKAVPMVALTCDRCGHVSFFLRHTLEKVVAESLKGAPAAESVG